MFTPVAGAGIAAGGAENTNMTEGPSVGETRGREASPPRPSTPSARLAVRVWESKWLRELKVEEGTVHAELDGDEIRTLMMIGEDEVYLSAICLCRRGCQALWCVEWNAQRGNCQMVTQDV